jgi:aldehyde:ferredoxin oxidoreductase
MRPKAYAGTILRVDLSTGRTERIDTHEYAGRFLGGRGLATAVYWNEVQPYVDAFDEGNRLILSLGPLAGVPALGGSRWVAAAKSPYPSRQHLCYGNLGGSFGAELKFAGYDGLIIQGRSDRPVTLSIRGGDVEISDASALRGKSAVDTITALKGTAGGGARVLAIGPAGENRVSFATLLGDGDASCSGGMGAVMGAKNLKAIAVQGGQRRVEVADPDRLTDIARTIRSYGRGNVKVWGLDFMAHGPKTRKYPCYGCMASCLRVKYFADNGKSGKFMCQSRFFYLPRAWSYYGDDSDVPFLANRLCDEAGVDTWEVQVLIELLDRCFEAGILTEKQTGLPLSRMGSLEFIEALTSMIAQRRGFGELLAQGAKKAALRIGGRAVSLLTSSDPYDPRYCTINTLLFPFETRQPIQQLHEAGLVLSQWSSWAKGVEGAHISSDVFRGIARRFWGGEAAADLTSFEGKAEAARRIQDRQLAKESLVVCDWMYPVIDIPRGEDHVGDPAIESRILSAATGVSFDEQDLYRIGERIFNLQRAILLLEGHRPRKDDILIREWHRQPLSTHVADPECAVPGRDGEIDSRIGEKIDMPAFLRLRDEYYGLRRWDVPTGLQTRTLLMDLELPEVAERLAAAGLLREKARAGSLPVHLRRAVRSGVSSLVRVAGRRAPKPGSGDTGGAREEVEPGELMALMEAQRRKFGDERVAHHFKGWNKRMQYHFTDTGEYYLICMVDGAAQPPQRLEKPLDRPDIVYEMDTGTLRAMTRGELSGLQAYQQRRLRLRASFFEMMKLQSLNQV